MTITKTTEELRIAQPVKNYPCFTEPEVSLPSSQQLATGPSPEPDESSPLPHTTL